HRPPIHIRLSPPRTADVNSPIALPPSLCLSCRGRTWPWPPRPRHAQTLFAVSRGTADSGRRTGKFPPLLHAYACLRRNSRPRRLPVQTRDHPSSASPATSAIRRAKRAMRGTMLSASRYSPGLWSDPPTGPSPSRQGIPRDETQLASEPPPVQTSSTEKFRDRAHRLASSARRRFPSVFSIGGNHSMPSTRASPPVTDGRAATSSNNRVAACSPPVLKRRTSISARARSGTTLDTVPPSILPMLM